MLYVFHGTDTYMIADRSNKLVASLRASKPEASVYVFEQETFETGALDELLETSGLFTDQHIVLLHGVCALKENRELLLPRLPRFAESAHIFVLVEGGVHPAHAKMFAEHAERVEAYSLPKKEKPDFDQYGLLSALRTRNKRFLWERFQVALHKGESPEGLCGLLHWGVRDMLQQPDRYRGVYTLEQLRTLSRSLIAVYHEAHRGRYDLALALERWALTL
jgi:hypothetical protein